MKTIIKLINNTALLAVCLFLSVLSVKADDVQESIYLDYLRTPEAAAFKKYGEESVNEYTGTADISVPLYTVKCKDIEIPLTLRYDASGIKVEQEASWVGLGWNMLVGGCINYVCAGGHDMLGAPAIGNEVWTEYLTSEFSFSTNGTNEYKSQTRYYKYNANDNFNWMAKFPLKPQNFVLSYIDNIAGGWGMKEYVDWGWGERDFYSVNVMGKSFMFFIDPFTLNVYNIGKAGENFKVEITEPELETKGIGRPASEDIKKWKITDTNGYVYYFEVGDKFHADSSTGMSYTSSWYLTKIQSPLGETAELKYDILTRPGRTSKVESFRLPIAHGGGLACCANVSQPTYENYKQNENAGMNVTSHYLREIETRNQTVTFVTSNCNECSGRRLDEIEVKSYNDTLIKRINFSYGSFEPSNVGGNYAPEDTNGDSGNRLKLDNVKDIASSDTLTTCFSYNSLKLPSKRSCAQDYWGYYNGQENEVTGRGHTLIPTPQNFMSTNYTKRLNGYSIGGADRYSRGDYMQAAILNRVVYPTGGYTTYEYEPNSILTADFTQTEKYREKQYDEFHEVSFSWDNRNGAYQANQEITFDLTEETTFDIYVKSQGTLIRGKEMQIMLQVWDDENNGYQTVSNTPVTCSSSGNYSYIESKVLPVGRCTLRIIPPSNISDGSLSVPPYETIGWGIGCQFVGWHQSTLTNTNSNTNKYYPLPCGGLRIKKISNYDNDGDMVNYTTYDYNGGALLNKIETIDYALCYNLAPEGGLPGNHNVEVYTITPGHSRMPAFFASCNPGIVGYSQVTKNKYDADDHLEKSVVTSYRNNEPQNMHTIDYYTCFDNGQMESQEIYDASNDMVAKTINTYECDMVDHYATNIVTKYKCLNHGSTALTAPLILEIYDAPSLIPTNTINTGAPNPEGVVDVLRYPYLLSRSELSKTTTTEYCQNGSNVVKTKEYSYNPVNHQVSQIDENTGLPDQVRRTKITYSADETDDVSSAMKGVHRLNDVVENKSILVEDGIEKRISTQHTTYGPHTHGFYFVPVSHSTSIGDNALETRAIYSYDDSLNVRSITVDGMETVYIWSYFGQYPIAMIEGLTYTDVEYAIGQSTISNLLSKAEPSDADFNSIRNAVNSMGGHVTTYTYKPLVGIKTETLPNGMKTTYKYDGFGRLTEVIDHNGSVISTNSYNYKK